MVLQAPEQGLAACFPVQTVSKQAQQCSHEAARPASCKVSPPAGYTGLPCCASDPCNCAVDCYSTGMYRGADGWPAFYYNCTAVSLQNTPRRQTPGGQAATANTQALPSLRHLRLPVLGKGVWLKNQLGTGSRIGNHSWLCNIKGML
eukprot:jgi/Astpho2/3455/fgenesh1_pg.00055_%23_19_t